MVKDKRLPQLPIYKGTSVLKDGNIRLLNDALRKESTDLGRSSVVSLDGRSVDDLNLIV